MEEQNSCTSSTFNVLDTKQYDLYILQYLPKKKRRRFSDIFDFMLSCLVFYFEIQIIFNLS